MATTKNITMKQFNGADYDTLYPKTIASQVDGVYNKTETLSAATAALYGLGTDAVPDDVLAMLKTLVDDAQNSADGKAKIEIGSYTGTGTYGSRNPKTLTFSFVPKIIFVQGASSSNTRDAGFAVLIPENPNGSMHDLASAGILSVSINGTTVSWYAIATIGSNGTSATAGASTMLNDSRRKYYYVAFG